MSSSCGDPSRKMPWYRQMMAMFAVENKQKEVERRANLPKEGNAQRRKVKQEDTLAGK